MSNPTNTVDLSQSFADFLAAHSPLLQQKVDKPGGAVPASGTIRSAGAVWGNFFDDFIMSFMQANGRVAKVTGNTTDATAAVVIGLAIPEVVDGSQSIVETHVWGRAAPNDFAYQHTIARVERNAGALQLYTDLSATVLYSSGGTLSAVSSGLGINGTALEIRVTGEVGTNIAWESQTSVTVAHG